MGIIRQLSPSVVNQIAAGEVIERPASVVKELLENAIDAGAKRVDLTVDRGGKDLIRVVDDGQGMEPDDLLLAFQPHATSKLAEAADLFRIHTLGFRGEALAAIAEVSKVRCQTRKADAPEGTELSIDGGVASGLRPCGGPVGTVMEVRNLFFNTPVRRTFLKSDSTEAGHVSEMFTRIALAHPDVHLTLRSGGKVIHDLPAVTGARERIATFHGRELAESLLWVEGSLNEIRLWGYVAHPSQSRSTAKGQYLFLNGRYVRDRSLTHALNEAYRGLLMVGRMPVAFLYLEMTPEDVDVNVHPTKAEVRFRDSNRVYSHLLSTLRQTFLKSDLHSRLQPVQDESGRDLSTPTPAPPATMPQAMTPSSFAFQTEPVPAQARGMGASTDSPVGVNRFDLTGAPEDRQTVASWFEPSRSSTSGVAGNRTFGPPPPAWSQSLTPELQVGTGSAFDEFAGRADAPLPPEPVSNVTAAVDPVDGPGKPSVAPELWEMPLKAIQVHDSYLIAETRDGMVVIDQHALHERILYEELRRRVADGQVEAQRLLVPEPVDLLAAEAAIVLEQRESLARLGLEIEPFGGDTVLVSAVPAMLPNIEPERLLRDLAEHLRSKPLPPTRDGLLAELLHMMACKAAIKANQPLTSGEISALLDRRHLVADSHHCPHGRPAALVFTKSDLEKQFGRI